jgi:hypothetical protein
MITRVFKFAANADGRVDFRIAYEAFRARDPQKIKDERKLLAEIQRALEAVSEPVGDLPEASDLDMRMRTLKKSGGTIRLAQRTFDRLEAFVNETPFQAGMSVAVEDFLDRWSAAEKDDDTASPRPRKVS